MSASDASNDPRISATDLTRLIGKCEKQLLAWGSADYLLMVRALKELEERRAHETNSNPVRDNVHLRILLAHTYGGVNLYTDDSELQDASCLPVIDFSRDSVSEIERKMEERGRRQLAEARDDGPYAFAVECSGCKKAMLLGLRRESYVFSVKCVCGVTTDTDYSHLKSESDSSP